VRYHQRYQIVQNRSLAYEIVARRSGGAPRTPDTGIPISPSPATRQDDRRAAPLWELVQRHFRQDDGLARWLGFVRWRRFSLVVGVGLWVDNDRNRIADPFSQVGRSNSTSGTMAARGATRGIQHDDDAAPGTSPTDLYAGLRYRPLEGKSFFCFARRSFK
jgi:hypothetical protein